MAITDVPAFAHLTDADIESLAVELDAIIEHGSAVDVLKRRLQQHPLYTMVVRVQNR